MKHPFAGIIIPETEVTASRRSALQIMAAGAAVASLAPAANLLAEDRVLAAAENDALHRQYLVIPKDVGKFGKRRREELGVLGPQFAIRAKGHKFSGKPGYLAWATEGQAKSLRAADGIKEVLDFSGAALEMGRKSRSLMITLSPNTWKSKPDKKTYKSGAELAKELSKEFAGKVTFSADRTDTFINAHFPGEPNPMLVSSLRMHPQAYQLFWRPTFVTTRALGEEGATTKRLGEEGGPRPTTLAIGEEGGKPRPTTEAVGEEGGVTTKALGEEGGRPKPSTRALGEEGGVTTQALGEEGGAKPPKKITTFALGEEGGKKR